MNDIEAPPELQTAVAECVRWSESNAVTCAADFQRTAEHLLSIKQNRKRADEFFDPPIKQAHELHKLLCQRKKVITDPLDRSEREDKRRMSDYAKAEEQKRQAEQRRLQAEADARAAREREVLERKAAAAKRPETQQKYAEAAAQVMPAPVIHVPVETPKVQGIQTRTVWRYRIVDVSKIPDEFLVVDEKKLAAYARAMKQAAHVPGVEFYSEQEIAAGRAAS